MKTFMKYSMMLSMTLFVAIFLMSGSAGAVVLAPADSDTTIVRPGLGIGNAPVVVVVPQPRPVFNPFFRFFNPFLFNPFDIDVDPFFGFGEEPFIGARPGFGFVNPGFAD